MFVGNDLVKRFIGGQKRSNKYRDVNYEQMKDMASKYKHSGLQSLRHVNKLSKTNKKSKEMSMLRQHCDVWIKECHNLNTTRNMIYVQLEAIRAKQLNCDDDELKRFFHEALKFEAQAQIDQEIFHTSTIKPILQLIDDLKYCMRQLSLQIDDQEAFEQHVCVNEQLLLVKQQQNNLQENMEEIYQAINADIEVVAKDYFDDISDDIQIEQGTPSCVTMLTCPYAELKASMLNEFFVVDQRYILQLDELKKKYSEHVK